MKAALYIRVSTHHQIDKDSLPFQRSELINYAKYALGITDYEIFEDAGYSGKNTDRPKFQEMMTRIRNQEFTHLLVWKIDRVSRNLIDFCDMYEEIKKYNCVFVSKNEQFDTSSAMGEAMLKIILVFAELERKLTAERVTGIMLSRAEKGLWNGANIPLGYKWDKVKKFPISDSEESKTVQYIFNKYKELKSATNVMRDLNENNIPTKRGGKWTSKTVTDIIRNPFYKGTYRYNYRESARGSKKDESEWIILEDNHDAIISKELWERCNEIMDVNAQRNSSMFRKNANTHIFSGILKCTSCGRGFIANQDQKRVDGYQPSVYRCQGKCRHYDCDAKMSSDIRIGPFVTNYISNFLKAQNKLKKTNTPDDLEKLLLTGDEFIGLELNKEDLLDTYTSIIYSYENNTILNKKKVKSTIDDTDLKSEKDKYKRALTRLQDLYLFSDDAMSEKDYLIKKKDLENKIKEIDNKLKISNSPEPSFDFSFLTELDNAILKSKIMDPKHIDFKKLDMSIDRELLKDFINILIDNIEITNAKVSAIHFKNGLVNRFIHKD